MIRLSSEESLPGKSDKDAEGDWWCKKTTLTALDPVNVFDVSDPGSGLQRVWTVKDYGRLSEESGPQIRCKLQTSRRRERVAVVLSNSFGRNSM